MSQIFDGLNHFCKVRYNDNFIKPGEAKQLIAKLDFATIVIYLVIEIELGNKTQEEIFINSGEIITPIFKELEYSVINNMDAFRTKLEVLFDNMYDELIKAYPYDIKSVSLVGQKEYEELR